MPVSSSGHLVLVQKIFGIEEEGILLLDTMLHVGTLIAVIGVFWKDIVSMIKKPFSKLPMYIVAATIPTVIIALLLQDHVAKAFSTASTLGFGFIITGLILMLVEMGKSGHKDIDSMTIKDTLIIGIAQGIAIFPAISRSGMTIAGALSQKLDRKFAARFSFLMSIPAIVGSIVFQMDDLVMAIQTPGFVGPMIAGTLAATLSGFFAINSMLRVLTKGNLKGFAYYVIVLGGFVLVDQFFLHILF